jgi:hypothetical protein
VFRVGMLGVAKLIAPVICLPKLIARNHPAESLCRLLNSWTRYCKWWAIDSPASSTVPLSTCSKARHCIKETHLDSEPLLGLGALAEMSYRSSTST